MLLTLPDVMGGNGRETFSEQYQNQTAFLELRRSYMVWCRANEGSMVPPLRISSPGNVILDCPYAVTADSQEFRDFSRGSVAKTPRSQCRGMHACVLSHV